MTMVNGFNNMAAIAGDLPDDVGRACMEAAKAMTKVSGSSFGTLMGISLMAVAKQTKGETEVEWSRFGALISTALDAMMARGGANLGDKTILDSLDAIRAACAEQTEPEAMLSAANAAALEALDAYRDKPNKIGRARIFGDKNIGMDDPGMVAIHKMVLTL
jgi:dihydroxyacetone kinase-like protein